MAVVLWVHCQLIWYLERSNQLIVNSSSHHGIFDGGGSEDPAPLIDLHQVRERGTNDFSGCFHSPVKLPVFMSLTAPKPGSEAVGQNAFSSSPVEDGEEMSGKPAFLSFWRRWIRCWNFLMTAVELGVEVRTSDKWTVSITVNDQHWVVVIANSPKIYHHLFCFVHIEGKFMKSATCCKLLHFQPVCRLVVVTNKTHHHCCVVGILNNVFGADSSSCGWAGRTAGGSGHSLGVKPYSQWWFLMFGCPP